MGRGSPASSSKYLVIIDDFRRQMARSRPPAIASVSAGDGRGYLLIRIIRTISLLYQLLFIVFQYPSPDPALVFQLSHPRRSYHLEGNRGYWGTD